MPEGFQAFYEDHMSTIQFADQVITVSDFGLTVTSTSGAVFLAHFDLMSADHARAIATALTDWADRQEASDA